ncbi:MAG: hypothetical protein ACTS77_04210 [Arsenophonus sp. NC-TX2-MAG3]
MNQLLQKLGYKADIQKILEALPFKKASLLVVFKICYSLLRKSETANEILALTMGWQTTSNLRMKDKFIKYATGYSLIAIH